MAEQRLPEAFILGAATSAYQIEGGWNEDGKGESIWDRFTRAPGAIEDGTSGDVACDHVHRWREDVDLMAELGLNAYRFSVSWPRVLPDGSGRVNPAGLAFYDRLVDALLEKGIDPFLTLYHWDLPQALQDRGGWPARLTVDAFCEYTEAVVRRLGDRVTYWTTLNEPAVSSYLGYFEGQHAPGHHDKREALAAVHHLLLAHGRSVPILREYVPEGQIGIVLNLYPVHPASPDNDDREAAEQTDARLNRTFLDPLSGRGYPRDALHDHGVLDEAIRDDDLRLISAPIDFLGVNYYSRQVVRNHVSHGVENAAPIVVPGAEMTAMQWEVYPEGLYELLRRLAREYAFPTYYITENGAAYEDMINGDGGVDDPDRISYLRRHLEQALRAERDGVPLRGYFAWSLLDNFEWTYGLGKRFGLVYTDFESGRRIPKSSFYWYKKTIAQRALA
jgi:beta-glucosidase